MGVGVSGGVDAQMALPTYTEPEKLGDKQSSETDEVFSQAQTFCISVLHAERNNGLW